MSLITRLDCLCRCAPTGSFNVGPWHCCMPACVLYLQVKAWCYYESRLLGAHHGLISTYALETLVLYVFNKYHRSIDGPLSVRPSFWH